MANADNFIVNTDYLVDKIVLMDEGVIDSSNPYWTRLPSLGANVGVVAVPVPTSINIDSVLMDGVWTNDNWNTYGKLTDNFYDSEVYVFISKGVLDDVPGNLICITYGILQQSSNHRYRVWATIEETDVTSSTTEKTSEKLISGLQKDTRNGILKIDSVTKHTITNSSKHFEIAHNLGFKPIFMHWYREAGEAWRIGENTLDGSTGLKMYATDTKIICDYLGTLSSTMDVLVKVYANGSS